MTDTVKAWIKERRQAHAFSTTGPWVQDEDEGILGLDVYTDAGSESAPDRWERQAADIRTEDADDAHFIVDAHNNLPRSLDALNAVLELHRRAVDIFEPSEFCAACSTDQRTVEYPCATVRAIVGAINE